jgi:hypothetical protein
LIQNPQPYKAYKHLRLGSACCGLPGGSGTVQTTRHIGWVLAIREDHPLAIEYEGAICTSSHSRLYRSRCILRRRNLPGRQLPPHLLNPPDLSYHWAIDGPDACILNGQPTHESVSLSSYPADRLFGPPSSPSAQVDLTGTATFHALVANVSHDIKALRRPHPPGFALSYARRPSPRICGWRRRPATTTMTTMTCFFADSVAA